MIRIRYARHNIKLYSKMCLHLHAHKWGRSRARFSIAVPLEAVDSTASALISECDGEEKSEKKEKQLHRLMGLKGNWEGFIDGLCGKILQMNISRKWEIALARIKKSLYLCDEVP